MFKKTATRLFLILLYILKVEFVKMALCIICKNALNSLQIVNGESVDHVGR